MDQSCEKLTSITESRTKVTSFVQYKGKKANWIGYILPSNCLLKHITGGKIKRQKDKEEELSSCWITLRE